MPIDLAAYGGVEQHALPTLAGATFMTTTRNGAIVISDGRLALQPS